MSIGSFLEVTLYVTFLPILPVIELVKYLTSKKESVAFDLWENGVPAFFCLGFLVITFVWPHYIEEWPPAEATVKFLTTVLQFLLPLQITAAIVRNRTGIGAYRKFTTKMLQLRRVLKGQLEEEFRYVGRAMKWRFRTKVDIVKLTEGKGLAGYEGKVLPDAFIERMQEQTFQIQNTAIANSGLSILNEAFGAYGQMKNLSEFKIPILFVCFFYVCITAYFFLLPYTFFADDPWTRVLKSLVNLYVFLGMFNITVMISNPFKSRSRLFQTVGEIENTYGRKVGLIPQIQSTPNFQSTQNFQIKLKI